MINYILPGLYENWQVNALLLENFRKYPFIFNNNINISAFYGNFPYCIWDGGRVFSTEDKHATKEEIEAIRDTLNYKYHVPMRFVFTNQSIEEKHCYDNFCNLVLQLCNNGLNEVVVHSPILAQYIKENYPKYKIVSSTTKCLSNKNDLINELSNDNFDMVCLDHNFNYNTKLMKDLGSSNYQSKIEILANPVCMAGCPYRKEHYKLVGEHYLSYGKNYNIESCLVDTNSLDPNPKYNVNKLTFEEIQEYNQKYNISNFKLEGRTFPPVEHTAVMAQYLIKPEYQLFILNYILQTYNKIQMNDLPHLEKFLLHLHEK